MLDSTRSVNEVRNEPSSMARLITQATKDQIRENILGGDSGGTVMIRHVLPYLSTTGADVQTASCSPLIVQVPGASDGAVGFVSRGAFFIAAHLYSRLARVH